MRIRILGLLATVLAGAGFAAAGDHGSFGSVSVFDKWKQRSCAKFAAPCEPCCTPTHLIPSPCLFHAEVGSPTYIEGKAMPPIQLLRAVPPSIELAAARPPELLYVRRTPPPVELMGAVPPRLDTFRREPAPLGSLPAIKLPSVAIFHVAQPPKPCCPPPVCGPCSSSGCGK
jgi:hypothetical protein